MEEVIMKWKSFKKAAIAATAVVASLSLFLGGCGAKKDNSVKNIQNKKELVVGTYADYAPYEFTIVKNGKQKIVGYDMMLAKEIAKSMGVKKVKIVNIAFPSLISELQNKKFDLIMSGMSYTPKRAKVVNFSKSYRTVHQVLLVSKVNKDKYKSIASLKGQKIGAQQSSYQDKIAKKVKGAKVVNETSLQTLASEVKNGSLDGLIATSDTAEAFAKEHPNEYAVDPHFTFKQDKMQAGTRVAVRKGDKALLKKVNATISKDQKNGKLNQLYNKAQDIQIKNAK